MKHTFVIPPIVRDECFIFDFQGIDKLLGCVVMRDLFIGPLGSKIMTMGLVEVLALSPDPCKTRMGLSGENRALTSGFIRFSPRLNISEIPIKVPVLWFNYNSRLCISKVLLFRLTGRKQ